MVIVVDECYLLIDNGKLFLIGNYLIEMLLLLYYFYAVGFEFEVVIIFGLMIKFEYWVMLYKDEKVMLFFEQYKLLFCNLKKFVDVVVSFNVDSEYAVIFVFGGYGVFIGLFES